MAVQWSVWFALLTVQLGFGAYGVIVSKFAKNNKADPLVFSLIRDSGAFPVLLLAAFIAEKNIKVPSLSDLPLFASFGLTGIFGSQFLYILGVYYTNANIASIFQLAIPVWTAVLAMLLRMEEPPPLSQLRGWSKIIGILLAAGGAALMVINKAKGGTGGSFAGYIFFLGNTLCTSVGVLLQKRFIFNQTKSEWKAIPITVTAWSYLFGAVFMGLTSLYYVNQPEKFTSFTKEEVYPIIYAIFIASALCYLLITWCNMQISASLVTASWPLQVLFCAILSYLILGAVMSTLEYIGGAILILGLFAVVWSSYVEEKEKSISLTIPPHSAGMQKDITLEITPFEK